MNKREREKAKREVERLISERGGYSRETLKSFGVPWPPKKGWKKALVAQMHRDGNLDKPVRLRTKKNGGFYSSWEWKNARYVALKTNGYRCQCCGWRPGDTDHGHLVVDHVKPRSKYPGLALEQSNLQVLCNDCNMGKSNIYEDDFREVEDWFRNLMRE